MDNSEFEYDVAISFAGEDRDTAERFALILKEKGLKVFYDIWEQADLWGRDLYQHLDDVYSKRARFCVMFLSKHYAAKAWTNHELKSAQTRAFQKSDEYILPIRLDDTAIPGIRPTLGYIDLRHMTVEKAAELAIQKILAAKTRGSNEPTTVVALPASIGKLHVKKQFTEQDRDAFLEEAYEVISQFFEATMNRLASDSPGFVGKFRRIDASHFTAIIYRDGKNVAQCGIRLGGTGHGIFRNQIVFSNDPSSTNSMNEGVSAENDGSQMFLKATGMSSVLQPNKKEKLTPREAAELFWNVLTRSLQH